MSWRQLVGSFYESHRWPIGFKVSIFPQDFSYLVHSVSHKRIAEYEGSNDIRISVFNQFGNRSPFIFLFLWRISC